MHEGMAGGGRGGEVGSGCLSDTILLKLAIPYGMRVNGSWLELITVIDIGIMLRLETRKMLLYRVI